MKSKIQVRLLLFLSAIFCGLGIDPFHSWGGDFALYIEQAMALLEGGTAELLANNAFAMEHSELVLGPSLYPPGFPILLAPIYATWGLNLLPMKTLVVLCFLLFQGVLFPYLSSHFSQKDAWIVLGLFSLNPWLIRYCDFVISDIPFLWFSTWALWESIHLDKVPTFSQGLRTGLVFAGSYLVRSVGIIWILTWGTYLMTKYVRSQRITISHFVPILVFLPIWGGIERVYPSGIGAYTSFLPEISPTTLVQNVVYYLSLPQTHLGILGTGVIWIIIPISVLGFWQHRQALSLEGLFCLFYLLVLIIWPYPDGIRFVFPLLPIFALTFSKGVQILYSGAKKLGKDLSYVESLKWGIVPILLLGCLYNVYRDFPPNPKGKVGSDESKELFAFLHQEAPDHPIAFFRPRILRLYSGKNGVAQSDIKVLDSLGVKWYVHYKPDAEISPEGKPIFENAEFSIFPISSLSIPERRGTP